MVRDDLLVEKFGLAIGIGGPERAVLWDGDHIREACGVAVNGSGGGEDDVGDVVLGHGSEEADCAVNIDAIVL